MSGRARSGDPYAGIPGRRLFVAVPLPEDAGAAVAAIVDEVRSQPLPPGMRDVRWVRLDGLHLTLRFLGPTPDERIDPTAAAIGRVAAASTAFEVSISGAGAFPAGPRPRSLWLGLGHGLEALEALAGDLGEALERVGWPLDPRPFRAHLTLARSDGLVAGPLVAGRLDAAVAGRMVTTTIERIGLFESVTGGGPARYVPVAAFGLGGPAAKGSPMYHQR